MSQFYNDVGYWQYTAVHKLSTHQITPNIGNGEMSGDYKEKFTHFLQGIKDLTSSFNNLQKSKELNSDEVEHFRVLIMFDFRNTVVRYVNENFPTQYSENMINKTEKLVYNEMSRLYQLITDTHKL